MKYRSNVKYVSRKWVYILHVYITITEREIFEHASMTEKSGMQVDIK